MNRIGKLWICLCVLAVTILGSGIVLPMTAYADGEEGLKNFYIPSSEDEDSFDGYFKVDPKGYFVDGEQNDYNLQYNKENRVLTLNNLNYTFTAYEVEESNKVTDYVSAFICMGEDSKAVTINLIGTNKITVERGISIDAPCPLSFTGSGTLEIVNKDEGVFEWWNNENGEIVAEDEPPAAMNFGGDKFSVDKARLILSSNNENLDLYIPNTAAVNITNGGKVSGKVAWEAVNSTGTDLIDPNSGVKPQPNAPVGYEYIGKAYYFVDIEYAPNNIFGSTDDWKIYGEYDSNGNPKKSYVYYQYLYASKATGMLLTDDRDEKTSFLVYDTKPEDLLGKHDVASISDGKNHVFNTDLYCVWMSKGNVTVNGNVIMDIACNRGIFFDNENPKMGNDNGYKYIYIPYRRDEKGGLAADVSEKESAASSVTVTGDAGLVSLGESFKGDVTIKGDLGMIGYYEDLNVNKLSVLYNREFWDDYQDDQEFWKNWSDGETDIDYGFEQHADHIYPARSINGKVVDKGKFTFDINDVKLEVNKEEVKGYGVYDDAFFMKTERTIGDETVNGTTAVINSDSLRVDVTSDKDAGIDVWTYPLVRKLKDETKLSNIKEQLTDASSKLSVMDISLICQNEEEASSNEVEPDKEITLYIDGLKDFTKPALYHVKDDGTIEKLFAYSGTDNFSGSFSAVTDSFSTYFVAEDRALKQEAKEDTPAPADGTTVTPGQPGGTTETPASGNTTTVPATADVGATITDAGKGGSSVYTVTGKSNGAGGTGEVIYSGEADGSKATKITIPDTIVGSDGATYVVTKIADNALKGNKKVKSITVGNNIVEIGSGAFQNATKLTTVKLGDKVSKIGKNAFKGDKKLKTVKVNGNSLKKVGKNAFKGIKKNAKITIYAKDKKTYKKAVKLMKKSGAKNVKYKFKKKK